MGEKIGIIGHVDHGKTTLASAIAVALATSDALAISDKKNAKKIQEIIEEERTTKITALAETTPIWDDFKSGKESRRARRKKERKSNKKK